MRIDKLQKLQAKADATTNEHERTAYLWKIAQVNAKARKIRNAYLPASLQLGRNLDATV